MYAHIETGACQSIFKIPGYRELRNRVLLFVACSTILFSCYAIGKQYSKEVTGLYFEVSTPQQDILRPYDKCLARARKNAALRCPWPPKNTTDLINSLTGRINLSLRPNVLSTKNRQWFTYLLQLRQLFPTYPPNIHGSVLRRMVYYDFVVRGGHNIPNYELYPQMLDLHETIAAIRSGEKVKETPINDVRLEVMESPKSVCTQKRTDTNMDLIVFVKTCSACFENRRKIRETYKQTHLWRNFKIEFIFVLGVPTSHQSDYYEFDGVRVPKYAPESSSLADSVEVSIGIFNENFVYQDMLIGSFEDTYYNLTKKMIFTLRWATIFCKRLTPLFMFIDDDRTLIPDKLVRLVKLIPPGMKRNFVGGQLLNVHVLRQSRWLSRRLSRWMISEDEFPWKYFPPYPNGVGYFLGADITADLSIAMAFVKELRVDDAYLGITLMKLHRLGFLVPQITDRIDWYVDRNKVAVLPSFYSNAINWTSGRLRHA